MIIAIFGQDTYLMRAKLAEVKEKFKKDVEGAENSLAVLDGEKISVDELKQALSSTSLFARKRLLILENANRNRSKRFVTDCLSLFKEKGWADDLEGNILIIYEELAADKSLGKNAYVSFLSSLKFHFFFEPMSVLQAVRWLEERASLRGLSFARPAANLLATSAEGDTWFLSREVDKLSAYVSAQSRTQITLEDVSALSVHQDSEKIFPLLDAFSTRNRALALDLLEQAHDAGLPEQYLLYMLAKQVYKLLLAKSATESGRPMSLWSAELGMKPFVAQKSASQARYFSHNELLSLLDDLMHADVAAKTGASPLRLSLSKIFSLL